MIKIEMIFFVLFYIKCSSAHLTDNPMLSVHINVDNLHLGKIKSYERVT